MKFSSLLSLFALMFLVGACSQSADDEGSEAIPGETIQVVSLKIDSTKLNRGEENSDIENIESKIYTVKACLQDRNNLRNFKNRTLTVNEQDMVSDSNGCLFFKHEVDVEYNSKDRCQMYEYEVSSEGMFLKKIRYTIDYLDNQISNLETAVGCMEKNTKASSIVEEPVRAGDIKVGWGGQISALRSDVRKLKHGTTVGMCLTATKTGVKVVNAPIRLKATNKETGEVSYSDDPTLKTGIDGCFTTYFESHFEQYRNSHWMDVELEIEVLDGVLAGSIFHRDIYINPWESGNMYGIGEIGRKPPVRKFKNDYARLHLDGVMYIQIGNDTENLKVNDYLGLTLSKTYQVVLNPYVDREHVFGQNRDAINRLVPDGEFKLSMVVLAPKEGDMLITSENYKDFEYITGVEQTVEIKNGVINAVVNIPFKLVDLPRLALRTMSIFKLEPLEDTGLRSTIVTGFFKARIPWIKTNVLQSNELNIPDFASKNWGHVPKVNKEQRFTKDNMLSSCSEYYKLSADECAEELKDYDEAKANYRTYVDGLFTRLSNETKSSFNIPIKPRTIFQNHLKKNIKNIQILSKTQFNNKFQAGLSKADFDAVFPAHKTSRQMPKWIIYRLCIFGTYGQNQIPTTFGFKSKDHEDCLNNPQNYFGMEGFRHVNKVKRTSGFYSNGYVLNTNEYAGVNDTEYDSYSESIGRFMSYDASVKFPVDKLPLIGNFIGAGFKTGFNRNWTNSSTESQGFTLVENIGTSKTIGVEKFVVNINAQFERCLLIQSKEHLDIEAAKRERDFARMFALSYDPNNWGELGTKYSPSNNFNLNFYICDDQVVTQDFREAWYFMQSEIHTNIGRDYDGQERKLLKVFRGVGNFFELRKKLRNVTQNKLIVDNVGLTTPDDTLVKNWGHLLDRSFSKSEAAKFIRENMDGAFPGTIQGQAAEKESD